MSRLSPHEAPANGIDLLSDAAARLLPLFCRRPRSRAPQPLSNLIELVSQTAFLTFCLANGASCL